MVAQEIHLDLVLILFLRLSSLGVEYIYLKEVSIQMYFLLILTLFLVGKSDSIRPSLLY